MTKSEPLPPMSARGARVFRTMAAEVKNVNVANGWYDESVSVGDLIALLHSEASEALDAWRKNGFEDVVEHNGLCQSLSRTFDKPCNCTPKPLGYGSELADVLIRLLDQADRHGVNLYAEYERKLAYNRTRGYRHGGRAM